MGTEAVLLQEYYSAFVPFTKKTQEGLSAWMENVPVDKDKWEKEVKMFLDSTDFCVLVVTCESNRV